MRWTGEIWQLLRDEELLGEIVIESPDFPWLSGRFVPQPAFDDVKPLFDEELALIESGMDDHVEEWELLYSRIADTLSLRSPRGLVPEFLLHVQGEQAWFRWSDEPFEADRG
ncbi:hypothetical protein [Amycolatopsis sp. NPDC059657]|uniref:hypothetical protein n=1 Tax=Amycolatopsis sp. NPDC059657 TaxID=3346899 RepID=UPI00366BF82C